MGWGAAAEADGERAHTHREAGGRGGSERKRVKRRRREAQGNMSVVKSTVGETFGQWAGAGWKDECFQWWNPGPYKHVLAPRAVLSS